MDPIEKLSKEPFIDLEIGQNTNVEDRQIPLKILVNNQLMPKCKDLLDCISKQSKELFLENVDEDEANSSESLLTSVNMAKTNSSQYLSKSVNKLKVQLKVVFS